MRFIILAIGIAGCDNGDKGGTTDTPLSYAEDVAPLVARNCTTSTCHDGPEATTGLDLRPEVALDQLVDVPSAQVPSWVRVVPGEPDASYLMAKLRGDAGAVGGEASLMPPGFGLASGDIAVFEAWIADGAAE